jgi:hypothetical protein
MDRGLLRGVIPRRFSAWQKLVALAPLLLVAVYLPGEMMLRCRIDGLLRPACCCPQESERQDSGPIVQAQDCCDRELAQNERPVVDTMRVAGRELVATAAIAPVAIPVSVILAPTCHADWATQRYGPAREGPPIVLVKHAFLI